MGLKQGHHISGAPTSCSTQQPYLTVVLPTCLVLLDSGNLLSPNLLNGTMQAGWARGVHKVIHKDRRWRPKAGQALRGSCTHNWCQLKSTSYPDTILLLWSAASHGFQLHLCFRESAFFQRSHTCHPPQARNSQGLGTREWQTGKYRRWPFASRSDQLCDVCVLWSSQWDLLDSGQENIPSCLSRFQLSRIY